MKLIFIVILILVAATNADVSELKQQIPIISMSQNVEHNGRFSYQYESGDGTKAQQDGDLKQIGDSAGEAVQGEYSYVGDDGQTYSLQYTADENGFQPSGDHLPTPPPIPEAIQKALDYIAAHPPANIE